MQTSEDTPDERARVADFPESALAPNGQPWWVLRTWPGQNKAFGVERRIAAWLAFHKRPGDTFTTVELRNALGDGDIPNGDEHFQRRLRELRKDGWQIPSVKYDRNLEVEHYRVDVSGWHPAQGPRPKKPTITAAVRREVFDRDQHRCWSCGLGANESNPANGNLPTVLTVGHVKALQHGGVSDPGNLRTECSYCNETVRSDMYEPPAIEIVMSKVRNLNSENLRLLLRWTADNGMASTPAFFLFNTWRQLSPADQERLTNELKALIKGWRP